MGNLKTSLSERIRNNPNFVNFFQSSSVSESDHSLVNLKRHYKWTRSTLFVVNFALLRQKLGNSTLVNKLDFDKISKQDVVTLIIDFIKSNSNEKYDIWDGAECRRKDGFQVFPVILAGPFETDILLRHYSL